MRRGKVLLGVAMAVAALGAAGIAISTARTLWFVWNVVHPPRRVPPRPRGMAVAEISFRTSHGEVRGWYVPPRNGAAIVLTHGTGEDRAQVEGELRLLGTAGFGVLAVDWPGNGESGGEMRLGTPERAAFRGAVDWLLRQEGVRPERIGAFGISVGGALVTAFAGDDDRVTALAAGGAFTDALEQTAYEFGNAWPWSRAAALWASRRVIEGGNLRPIDGASKLRNRRALFITFERDPVIPPRMSDELAAVAGGEVYRLPGEGHGTYARDGGRAYAEKLVGFFEEALLRGQR